VTPAQCTAKYITRTRICYAKQLPGALHGRSAAVEMCGQTHLDQDRITEDNGCPAAPASNSTAMKKMWIGWP